MEVEDGASRVDDAKEEDDDVPNGSMGENEEGGKYPMEEGEAMLKDKVLRSYLTRGVSASR